MSLILSALLLPFLQPILTYKADWLTIDVSVMSDDGESDE